ncbi:hypothetical protein A3C09_04630 [Candidatus Uhrbacteria bacterium RIFCSPHIGHO2_02_FULL_47_44]|uniref:Uncharacterized protein n=1 Tax=Candidatus Uhrbacteria bacterium RIFCSPLOWO2_02_FULL_48_18 TaxID=1802408 RepID=A0A1F7VCM6_9BACT|nr:MAG: hypothetical protein A2839_04485 [Candidatus Uhrbacteria bacterium RIFCSPHIGHO2_01_FULL_47_10]OGL71917.1 MAG: hypothetical protein A3C09_04630 [Candidatus Uhrbacteria bacterium RIFCSPHIGHO2_02_FULL_47_44]OGL77727.1 MAG: hypothetical protein A3E97_00025 [Candidatus Uhrbacteria bacterium RIFCSPHIGHO2_12_FULL_47_12]OGL80541.1 MAG: hypothetical protein A3B20_04020 [Candidatus Uhrbacteria bacterium RIFCSPLOWO2_01_FULL_47_17]OGL88276.1 MAG: hypothetical protein A3I41_00960 [Candidatus Uhrbact
MSRLFISLGAIIVLAACGTDAAKMATENPSNILQAFALLVGTLTFLLCLIGEQDLWPNAILNATKYSGFICVVVGPLFYISTQKIELALAISLSGGLILSGLHLFFKKEFQQMTRVETQREEEE